MEATVKHTSPAQLNLFAKTIADKFAAFHDAYPNVYVLFERFSLQLLMSGHKKIGAKMIMERVRWECATGSNDETGYKINNNYIAHYARLFIKRNPEYKECFETRVLKTL